MILRPYQTQAVAEALRLIRAGRRPVVAVPTGGGKTLIGATVCAAFTGRIRWTAHRRELINQARAKVPATVGVFAVQERRTVVADLLVVDECHHSVSPSYRRHIDAHDGPILGLTATPYRLDGRGLGEVFTDIVAPVTPSDLIASGVLVEPRYYALPGAPAAELAGIKRRAGDYALDQVAAVVDKPRVVGCAVREYRSRVNGSRAVAFCVNVAHAEHVAAAFRDAGTPAAVLTGTMPTAERDRVLADLAAGTLRVVSSCMVLTEGWDLPALETAIILRPTTSLNLHLQMIGRIMRAAPGKTGAVVHDHAGNVLRLGRVTDPVEFSLDGAAKAAASKGTGLKTCPACYALIPVAQNPCDCGHEWTVEEQRDLVVMGIGGTETLEDLKGPPVQVFSPAAWDDAVRTTRSVGAAKWAYKATVGSWPLIAADGRILDPYSEEGRKRAYFELLQYADSKGHALGSAAHKYASRYGSMPPFEWKLKYEAWKATLDKDARHG